MPMPNAPLFAYGNRHVSPSWFVRGLRYVLQQSRRIRVLALQLPNTIWEEALKTTYGGTFGPAPELRQITLLNSHSAPLPNIFPHEGLPSLQTLDIQGYHFLWHQPLLRLTTLSSLVIHNVYRPSLKVGPGHNPPHHVIITVTLGHFLAGKSGLQRLQLLLLRPQTQSRKSGTVKFGTKLFLIF